MASENTSLAISVCTANCLLSALNNDGLYLDTFAYLEFIRLYPVYIPWRTR